jgi:PAS domain S-box-containing protein
MLDEKGKYVRWNVYQRDEIVGKPEIMMVDTYAIDTIHPDDRELIGSSIANVFKNGAAEIVEGRVLLRGGPTFRWMLMTGRRIVIEERPYLLGIGIDITKRKKAEESLSDSEERYRTLANSGQALIWTSGLDKKCDYFNLPWLTFTGKRIEDEIGDGWVNGVHPDDLQRCVDIYVNAFDHREKFSMNYRIRHNSGEYRWIQDDGIPRYNSKGEFIGYIGHCLDITDRKQAEEALSTVQKLESLGILAGGIAHDFNNILAMIFGYVEMASRRSKEEQTIGNLKKCLAAIDRARDLTGQLLTFSKGGTPKRIIEPLFPLVQESAQFALSGSNVTCSFNISQDLAMCNYDRNQIGQVIDNIIINAKQAMPLGGTIELSAKNVLLGNKEHAILAKGRYIMLSIKDCGTGIPQEMLPRIFDPFFTTKTSGHGLGLATCYSIIKRHDGCIDVESEPGKGSTFHIYLPAANGEITPSRTNLPAFEKRSGTFLIMDDEECILEVNKYMLESLGYTFVGKSDGKAAISFVAEEIKANRSIAGIILDLTVPGGMGGKEAVKEIRKLCPKTPIFVASGYAEDPVVAQPKEHGFTASICKPFTLDELSEICGKYMTTQHLS